MVDSKKLKEYLDYLAIDRTGKKVFYHINYSERQTEKLILMIDPILDEEKRVHKFQAETARKLAEIHHVVRFDFHGTGDSYGDCYSFDLYDSECNIAWICDYFKKKLNIKEFIFIGIRIGADVALKVATQLNYVNEIIAIEPIIEGSRFLIEQRSRRKVSAKLNNIKLNEEPIQILGKNYEDYQGFLLSEETLNYIKNLKTYNLKIESKKILIIKVNSITNKKLMHNMICNFQNKNRVVEKQVNCGDFWSAFEPLDTRMITNVLFNYIK